MLIRPLKQSEYGLLERFLYEAIHVPQGHGPYAKDIIYTPEIYVYIKDFGKPDDLGLVAELDSGVVGLASGRILAGPEIKGYGNIDATTPELMISVLPEARGQGVGTKLIETLHTVLRKRGEKQISLSVQKTNPAARLYQRLGYVIIKENGDDYIMVKSLKKEIRNV